jgi:hypothetical protein
MGWITVLKCGAIAAVLVGLFACGYHMGSANGRADVEALRAAQAAAVAKAVLAEKAASDAEHARQAGIIEDYEHALLHPVDLHIGRRLLVAACPGAAAVPETGPNPGSFGDPAAVAGGDPGLGPAIDRVIAACRDDASQLSALIEAWPR